MKRRFDDLDADTRAYLQHVWKTRGGDSVGVFISSVPSGAAWVGWLIALGLVALGLAALLCAPQPVTETRSNWQVGLTFLGILALVGAGLGLRSRMRRRAAVGDFTYADALHLWQVRGGNVEVTPLENALDANGKYGPVAGGGYAAQLELLLPKQVVKFQIGSRPRGEELLKFLSALIVLRKPADSFPEVFKNNPLLLGAAALQLARQAGRIDLSRVDLDAPLPPRRVAAVSGGRWLRRALPWAVAAAAAGVALFAFPLLDGYLYDEHLFAAASTASPTNLGPLDAYLAAFPTDGRHTAETAALRDDLRFDLARGEAQAKHSPAEVRKYLADAGNVRHRDDAQRMINLFYDEAVARLHKLAEGKKVDEPLFNALLALLEGLKTADDPVVTIGFKADQEPTPGRLLAQIEEKAQYSSYLEDESSGRELRDIADRSPDHTAILPLGAVFAPVQTARREEVILNRLRDSLQKVLGADILTLRPAKAGARPVIEVAYHTYSEGGLYRYTSTERTQWPGQFGAQETKTVKGLLRGYQTDWTITIRPPGGAAEHVCDLASAPALSLHYDAKPGDPDWAPYAVILYSGFFDMSSRLITSFGLDAPPAPASYGFDDAAGK